LEFEVQEEAEGEDSISIIIHINNFTSIRHHPMDLTDLLDSVLLLSPMNLVLSEEVTGEEWEGEREIEREVKGAAETVEKG